MRKLGKINNCLLIVRTKSFFRGVSRKNSLVSLTPHFPPRRPRDLKLKKTGKLEKEIPVHLLHSLSLTRWVSFTPKAILYTREPHGHFLSSVAWWLLQHPRSKVVQPLSQATFFSFFPKPPKQQPLWKYPGPRPRCMNRSVRLLF